jgi:hypothetical protein
MAETTRTPPTEAPKAAEEKPPAPAVADDYEDSEDEFDELDGSFPQPRHSFRC